MQAFWTGTPYYDFYFYMGGTNGRALCGPGGVNAAWVDQVTNIGFSLVPIWVGRSGNCGTSATQVSCDANIAFQQGSSDASSAYSAWLGFGFSGNNVLALDMEAYDTSSVTNRNAVDAYVSGFVSLLHVAPAQFAVVYGSACGSAVLDWASISNVPDAVWLAFWPGGPGNNNVWGAPCVPDGYWSFDQRYHQWWGTHNDTRNGVTLSIDTDCADSNVSPTGRFDPSHSGQSFGVQCNGYF